MKKLILLPLLFLSLFVFAQKQIIVQNGTARSFDNLTTAIDSANTGDTLYIPGGGFTTPSNIDKTLHWRGVGHYPDSTIATGHTQIASALTFTGNCDNSTFEGIYFTNSLTFGTVTNEEVTGVKIKRCRVDGIITLRKDANITNGYPDLGFHLSECVVTTINGQDARNCLIENNLIFINCFSFHYSIFNHNAFYYHALLFYYSTNCRYTNNIFAWNPNLSRSSNCEFSNNIFTGNLPYTPSTGSFTGSNNITNVTQNTIYTSITGLLYQFSYDNDYHLKEGSTGTNEEGITGTTIFGTASDGTNPGIYGGAMPYKEGAVPYSPHIRSVDIASEAVNGNLGVKITVAAQEK